MKYIALYGFFFQERWCVNGPKCDRSTSLPDAGQEEADVDADGVFQFDGDRGHGDAVTVHPAPEFDFLRRGGYVYTLSFVCLIGRADFFRMIA